MEQAVIFTANLQPVESIYCISHCRKYKADFSKQLRFLLGFFFQIGGTDYTCQVLSLQFHCSSNCPVQFFTTVTKHDPQLTSHLSI